jgi:sulfur carrier protein
MHVLVNGQAREVPGRLTIEGLLAYLGVSLQAVVVERNGGVLERKNHARVEVEAGDRLEIVRFVGGG